MMSHHLCFRTCGFIHLELRVEVGWNTNTEMLCPITKRVFCVCSFIPFFQQEACRLIKFILGVRDPHRNIQELDRATKIKNSLCVHRKKLEREKAQAKESVRIHHLDPPECLSTCSPCHKSFSYYSQTNCIVRPLASQLLEKMRT